MTEKERMLRTVAAGVDEALRLVYDQRMGYVLLVFPFGEAPDGRVADYISNSRRAGIIAALQEAAERLQRGQDIPVTEGEG